MKFRRQRFQFGCIDRKQRKKGPDVWVLRYREYLLDGSAKQRSIIIGTVEERPTKAQARKRAQTLLLSINAEITNNQIVTFGALVDRHLAEEIPESTSPCEGIQSYCNNRIGTKWCVSQRSVL